MVFVFVEGDNEHTYLSKLYKALKIHKVNLWEYNESRLKGKLRQLDKQAQLVIIADTDVLDHAQRFISNFSVLRHHFNKAPIILLQNKNFEEELAFSCSCSLGDILKGFRAQGQNEFKNKFNQESNLPRKLNTLSHCMDKMWTQSSNRARQIGCLKQVIKDIYDKNDEFDYFVRI